MDNYVHNFGPDGGYPLQPRCVWCGRPARCCALAPASRSALSGLWLAIGFSVIKSGHHDHGTFHVKQWAAMTGPFFKLIATLRRDCSSARRQDTTRRKQRRRLRGCSARIQRIARLSYVEGSSFMTWVCPRPGARSAELVKSHLRLSNGFFHHGRRHSASSRLDIEPKTSERSAD